MIVDCKTASVEAEIDSVAHWKHCRHYVVGDFAVLGVGECELVETWGEKSHSPAVCADPQVFRRVGVERIEGVARQRRVRHREVFNRAVGTFHPQAVAVGGKTYGTVLHRGLHKVVGDEQSRVFNEPS